MMLVVLVVVLVVVILVEMDGDGAQVPRGVEDGGLHLHVHQLPGGQGGPRLQPHRQLQAPPGPQPCLP